MASEAPDPRPTFEECLAEAYEVYVEEIYAELERAERRDT